MITATVKGLPELAAAANATADGVKTDEQTAIMEATKTLERAIEARAPVRTRRLKNSIRSEVTGETGRISITATRSSRRYPNFPYPLVVERRRPFAQPAVEAVAKQAIDQAEKKVGDGAERRWAGGGR